MIQLTQKIGAGTERDVYIHPHNDSLVIKINRPDVAKDVNKVEYDYYMSRIANTELEIYFPRILGWQETLLGTGLVVDCVRDHDGRISRDLSEAIEDKIIKYLDAREKIEAEALIAIKHGLLMRELDAVNILVRLKDGRRDFDIVIVDGFGSVARSLKTILRLKFRLLSRMKARKSWKNQIALLDAWADSALNLGSGSRLVGS